MTVETVKVYKGEMVVTVNKCDVEEWNDRGYKTSAQQKEAAKKKALKKEDGTKSKSSE